MGQAEPIDDSAEASSIAEEQPFETPSQEPAVTLENVTVAYRSYKERPTSLKESLIRMFKSGKIKHYTTFDALHDVSLEIPKASVLAIIGSNGSGKSTMLKVISGVLKPTTGRVALDGKIASLIELGAGFDPELTAIENIYLNGSLHGRTRKEISARVEPILEFAELHEFADTPVKYFSSGMYARLGFSVAIDIDPEILIVDEILGVGDERFQSKCYGVFQRFIEQKKTIIVVSHALKLVEDLATDAILLSRGKLVFRGDPLEAISIYRESTYETALV